MTTGEASAPPPPATDRPWTRIAAYYVLLFSVAGLLAYWVPGFREFLSPSQDPVIASTLGSGVERMFVTDPLLLSGAAGIGLTILVSMIVSWLLMLPVCWVYIETRQRKGYRQSVVHALILLPLVVTGVVSLVKNSTALAFGLGGIVGAVSFRNTLRDTKDSIFIFLAIGVGVAAGVQAVVVAAVLSLGFAVAILGLWWSDFGRAPRGIEGPAAARRLQRALALGNRTSALVAHLDRDLLRSMAPEQLDVLARHAQRRRRQALDQMIDSNRPAGEPNAPDPSRDRTLRLTVTGPLDAARSAVEAALEPTVKRWEFVATAANSAGGHDLTYRVRIRKRTPADELLQELRGRCAQVLESAVLQ
jgi:hypothetical protein